MLNYSSYPHIFDAIFDSAFPTSYLTLRHVCREWRLKVLARCYHLRPGVTLDVTGEDIQSVYFKGGHWGGMHQLLLRGAEHALRYCRILDVADEEFFLWPLAPNVEVVRFVGARVPEGLQLPFVDRFVLSSMPPVLDPLWKANKLVLNHNSYTGLAWDRITHTALPDVKEVVYIFDPEQLSLEKAEGLPAPEGVLISTFYRLGKILHAAAARGVPVTVVGAEALDLTEERPPGQPELRGHAIVEFLKETVFDPATYMSREAYRESVGEVDYAIETDFATPLLRGPPIFYLKALPERERRSWCVVQ